jgi:hypothetical protein
LKATGAVSHELVVSIIESVAKREIMCSLMELSALLRVLSEFYLGEPIRRFSERMMRDWKGSSLIFDKLFLVHLRFLRRSFSNSHGAFGLEDESVIKSCLESTRPSKFLCGLGQLDLAVTRISDIRILKNLSELLVSRFPRFRGIREITVSTINLVSRIIMEPSYSPSHPRIYDGLLFSLSLQSSSAAFCDSLRWVPIAIRMSAAYRSLGNWLNMFVRVRNVETFQLAIAVLSEQVEKTPLDQREAIVMDSFLKFLSDHRDHQSIYSCYYLTSFMRFFLMLQRDALFHFCVNCVKSVRFLPVFLCFADVLRNVRDPEWCAQMLEELVLVTVTKEHTQALAALKASGKINQEAVRLASVNGN